LFEEINNMYSEALRKHGDSPNAVFIPKNNQHLRYQSALNSLPNLPKLEILDYGCGLGHLYDFLEKNLMSFFNYTGVDINEEFISFNSVKYPNLVFLHRDYFLHEDSMYDAIISIGTFNLQYVPNKWDNQKFVLDEILKLWQKTRKVLYINFMHNLVDYEQPLAHHQSVGAIFDFSFRNLSKNIFIDNTFLPYEFAIIIRREGVV
jgi:SAM-dependent methyltransferase